MSAPSHTAVEADRPVRSAGDVGSGPARGAARWVEVLVLAVAAYAPMLWAQPGAVTEDTKTYLYLDPGRYVRQAASLWNPNIALGTVTHENIGYLFPMGPFFWICAELHLPIWVAQRLWLGTLLFAAGAGVLYLSRVLGLGRPGRFVAAFVFMFTPYILQYSGRISVILMPWSGLPWMLAFVVLALRRPGWRYPALFAVVVALVSSINASSLLYVGIGPALWLPFAVVVLREHRWSDAWRVAWRVALLTLLVSAWWIVALQVESAFGVDILRYTETIQSTASASSPTEILRSLGYWFFYGASPQTGPWTQAAAAYTQHLWLIGLSFAVPALAVAAGAFVRWRFRTFFIALVALGMVLAVGPYPYGRPTGVSGLLKYIMENTTAGLAMRSTDRASPLILLGLAMLLGAGATAVAARIRRGAVLVTGVVVALVVGAATPLWTGATVVDGLTQPASPPDYVRQAAASLNATNPGTRVFGVPGENFAAYRWGDTNDTVYPGLLTRPYVTHEQQTMGSMATADLLEAVDTPLQEGVEDPRTIAPMSALMSAGNVLVQYDQAYERYNSVNPRVLARTFTPTPPGLGDRRAFGTPRPNVSTVPDLDPRTLSLPVGQGLTAPLVTYAVDHPRPVVRTESTASPLVVAGNGAGLVAASGFGLLADNPTVYYSGTLDAHPTFRAAALGGSPSLVVTDTNARQDYRWNGITQNAGYVREQVTPADEAPDPKSSPLNIFPGAPANAYSTTVYTGVSSVTASAYGSPVQYFNDQRPAAAMDGNPATAWTLSGYPQGQWWEVVLAKPVTTDTVTLSQLITPRPRQILDEVTLSFDYIHPVTVHLTAASRTPAGQVIHFPRRTFSLLRITMGHSHGTPYKVPAGYENTVGLSEVTIPGVVATEAVAMPQDLLRTTGTRSLSSPLTLVMTRLRGSGYPPRGDYQADLARQFWLPTDRTFQATGQARISPLAPDQTVSAALGRTGAGGTVVAVSSSSRLAGNVAAGPLAAIDGDPATAWQSDLGAPSQAGQWVQYTLSAPQTVERLDLGVVADGRHSVPTRISVSAGGRTETVALPAVADRAAPGAVVRVPVTLPAPVTGSTVRVTVDAVRQETTTDYATQATVTLPVGLAELGIPGLVAPPVPVALPGTCRDDLLTVDGRPVWTAVTGSTADALARRPLALALCGPDAGGLALAAGTHDLRSVAGATTGLDVDALALASAPGGGPAAVSPAGQLEAVRTAATPTVTLGRQTATRIPVTLHGVTAATPPFQLVLGQSINPGWTATAGGQTLAEPVLTDGFANGWRIDPARLAGAIHGGELTVDLRWTPQETVNAAVVVSAAALVACLVLAVLPAVRRRSRDADGRTEPDPSDGTDRSAEAPVLLGGTVPVLAERRDTPAPARWSTSLVTAAAVGVVVWAVSLPVIGLPAALATGLVLRRPRWRPLLGAIAAAAVVAVGVVVVISQLVAPQPATGGWPSAHEAADALVWVGVLFLAADAVVELVTGRVRRPGGPVPVPEAPVGGEAAAPVGPDVTP